MLEIGTVVAPSGKLLIVDPGYLRLWYGEQTPGMPDDVLSPQGTVAARTAVDLKLVGPGAEEVGRALDVQWNPSFLFDIAREWVPAETERVRQKARELGVRADVEVLPRRVSHRERVDLALTRGERAGEIMFNGIWAAVLGDVPAGQLRVFAEPMPEGHVEAGRLRRVTIEVRGGTMVHSQPIGHAMVDYARLLVIDVDAASNWTSDLSLDGLSDLVFWGRDAAALATLEGAVSISGEGFGWRNLPFDEAFRRRQRLDALVRERGWNVAMDLRPHSHLHLLMEQVRARDPGAGSVRVGDAVACGFATSWGDGIFEVHRDLDAEGRTLRVRIELGTEQRVDFMQRLKFRWSTRAIVSRKILDEGMPVRFMFREEPHHEGDSGWHLMSGFEGDGYNDDAKNFAFVLLCELPQDEQVDDLLDMPVGSVFEKRPGMEEFVRVTDWSPDDE